MKVCLLIWLCVLSSNVGAYIALFASDPFDQLTKLEALKQPSTDQTLQLAQLYATDLRHEQAHELLNSINFDALTARQQASFLLTQIEYASSYLTLEQLEQKISQGLRLAQSLNDHELQVAMQLNLSNWYLLQFNYPEALKAITAAAELAQQHELDILPAIEAAQLSFIYHSGRSVALQAQLDKLDAALKQRNMPFASMLLNELSLYNALAFDDFEQAEAFSVALGQVADQSHYGNTRAALGLLHIALARGKASPDLIRSVGQQLEGIEDKWHRFEIALTYANYLSLIDSQFNTEAFAHAEQLAEQLTLSSDRARAYEMHAFISYEVHKAIGLDPARALLSLEHYIALQKEAWQEVDMQAEQAMTRELRNQVLSYENQVLQLQSESQALALASAEQYRVQLRLVVATVVSLLLTAIVLGWAAWKRAERMSWQARTDALTGLANRRAFDSQLMKLTSRQQSFGVLLIDADHFKQVNDQYGHNVGDIVLEQLARIIQSCCRTSDMVCRYGGEEFAVILPDITPRDLHLCAERIRASVEQKAFLIAQLTLRLTVSIGGGMYDGRMASKSLIGIADERLYRVKARGRNDCLVSEA